jgi:Zn-dependent peptidase ImmA (M78 family)
MNINGKINPKIKSALKYFADNLISKQLQRFISVKIVFISNADNYGEVEITDYNTKGPRDFTLFIDKNLPEEEKIRTIAHELVHVKQYVYNELNEQMTMWRGKKVSEDDYLNYNDRPWEREAYKMEKKLYGDYIKTNR